MSGRCPNEQQSGLGRHRTAANGGRRRKWSQEANQIVTKCFYLSKSGVMGVTEESDKNGCEGSIGFVEEDNVMCENDCLVVLQG